MAQATKGKLNYRCPNCFARDIDMDMFFDETTGEYYCLRCCYHGKEEDVLKQYDQYLKNIKQGSNKYEIGNRYIYISRNGRNP